MSVLSGASRQGNADGRLGISAAPVWSPAAHPEELHLLGVLFLIAAAAAAGGGGGGGGGCGGGNMLAALLAPQAEAEKCGRRRRRGMRTRNCMARAVLGEAVFAAFGGGGVRRERLKTVAVRARRDEAYAVRKSAIERGRFREASATKLSTTE